MNRNQWILTFGIASVILSLPIGWQQQSAEAANVETISELAAKVEQASEKSLESTNLVKSLSPRISFEKTVCDLGEIGQGTKNTCEFRFTNTGRGLLKIGKISRTCGCTVFQLDKKEYAPNEIIHSFWPAYKRPFLWPCGRRPVFATKFTLQANPAENTKLVTKQRKSA